MVRARIEINIDKERTKLIRKKQMKAWSQPKNETEFADHITVHLQNRPPTNDINQLNKLITNTIAEAQRKCCTVNKREERITANTKLKMEERREMLKDKNIEQQSLNKINKEQVSKAIRKDIRAYKNEKISQTIEHNKSMKILRKKLTN
uniref:Uncharacterized protein LOC114347915 n=1 Tax=Diabrotica virgifera virgifera TaxID=50390 RepID=A0A6P7H737_DIAVI